MNSYDTKTWAWEAQVNALKSELEVQAAEIERLRAALADPSAVHINMLRGVIAKPTLPQIIHLYGKDAISAALNGEEDRT